jgi:predicted TIM-barrel fold metal-dependent hydrolase
VLALGREGAATVKLSSPFRVSLQPTVYDDLDPFVDALRAAYGVERFLWGSDWPFINVPRRPVYDDVRAPLPRWVPDPQERMRVLFDNPRRLFGFGDHA